MLNKFKINKKLLKQLDFSIIIITVLMVCFGAMNIYSAKGFKYFKLQIMWLILGLIVMYIILTFDYNIIGNYAELIYWAGVVMLVLNDFVFGKITKGARSWIGIGNRAIQTSEFAKVGLILILAKKIDDMEGNINNPKNIFIIFFYSVIPIYLVIRQPDAGMTMIYSAIVLGIVFIAGLNWKTIISGLVGVFGCIVLAWNVGLIHAYQKTRIISFFNPEKDELGANLQLNQSLIAIGSGRIFGKGYMKGTQSSLRFIPEAYTDFIFSVVGEEWGLIGAALLLLMYGILMYKFINIAKNSKDIFGSIICVGVISTFLFSILQNIGMTIGMMPITGITLPLMSYGGSSILSSFIGIALVLNVGMRRKKINF